MRIKNFIYVMLCICVAFLVSGCGKDNDVTIVPTEFPLPTKQVVTLAPTKAELDPTIAPPENMEITIYTLNPDSLENAICYSV